MNVTFATKVPHSGRVHFLSTEDVTVVLNRLPQRLWSRLRQVHFNDRAWGNRRCGYVTGSRREITICALPVNVSLSRGAVKYGFASREFGAPARGQWPREAIRRFLLYEVFLHEVGHLQIVRPRASNASRRFAGEKYAEAFAIRWRRKLWQEQFDHVDPIHNPPDREFSFCVSETNKRHERTPGRAISRQN